MATTMKRIGFGQVEPNHLSAQGNRQIYAQLPAKADIKILENGEKRSFFSILAPRVVKVKLTLKEKAEQQHEKISKNMKSSFSII